MGNKKKDPLNRRILREIRGEWVKYLVISLFLILTIGFVSGVYVANNSMLTSAREGIKEYNREDGHFVLNGEASDQLLSKLKDFDSDSSKAEGTTIYASFFKNSTEDNDSDGTKDGDIRVYERNDDVNRTSVLEGRLPKGENEIAIDRMHADNAGITIGDTIKVSGVKFKVVGLISYANYYTLHEKNSDFMFDALKFDVSMVTSDGFRRIGDPVRYNYAWKYGSEPANDTQAMDLSKDFLKELNVETASYGVQILDYLPAYSNSAINFATDDMGSDKAMAGVLLNVLIVIIAFIFLITTMNTIEKESRVIGTLLASGYTRRELLGHYLSINMLVTIFSAAVGNLLGYTILKNVVINMYYNSYSLPAYKTILSSEALIKTTLIPIALVLVINLAGLSWKLGHTPLQFLRQNLSRGGGRRAVRLPDVKFFNRFRLRVLIQNLPNYGVLFLGILFVMILLSMAVGLPETLNRYQSEAPDMMISHYQYILNTSDVPDAIVEKAEDDGAEEFSVVTLEKQSSRLTEEVTVYGVKDGSSYVDISGLKDLKEDHVYISSDYAEKYRVEKGDRITLHDKYSSKKYTFTVDGTYDGAYGIDVFMSGSRFASTFEDNSNRLSGFFSQKKLDLPDSMIATTITKQDITKICDQLNHSMGGYMSYFQVLCVLLSAALIYLLTKTIIEKNQRSISMTKILGYTDREIGSLYLVPTTVWVVTSALICSWLGAYFMKELWRAMMMDYAGWFTFSISGSELAKMFFSVLAGYVVVLFLDFRRIKGIQMDQALKDIE